MTLHARIGPRTRELRPPGARMVSQIEPSEIVMYRGTMGQRCNASNPTVHLFTPNDESLAGLYRRVI